MALWINMSGPPSTLLTWLSGHSVAMAGSSVPSPGPVVDAAAIQAYLRATRYFRDNPRNFTHLTECAAAGMNAIAVV